MAHGLFGVPLYSKSKGTTHICEGIWDGMALWELLRASKLNAQGSIEVTTSLASSLYAWQNVLAVPGANVFSDKWLPLVDDREVTLLYDNDHPRTIQGRVVDGAGLAGTKRVASLFSKNERRPKSLSYLRWGSDGVDLKRASGFDIRDLLTKEPSLESRISLLKTLLAKITPVPATWFNARARTPELPALACNSWERLVEAWDEAMKFTGGLRTALAVSLASIVSTPATGQQLWIKMIGPPSCGKSVLCEALSANKKYVFAKSTIKGFHSGYRMGRTDEDNSLIPLIKGKTLVTKDGDTLLSSDNLKIILSEARDLFDRNSRSHYRNQMGKDYEGIPVTWILAGTEALRLLDTSELGERFLDVVVIDEMSAELENEIAWYVAKRAQRGMGVVVDGTPESQETPELIRARQLTSGYINYLREHPTSLDQIEFLEERVGYCVSMGQFVSFMRARPSLRQEERAQRELSLRLVEQLVRLAICTARALTKTEVDDDVLGIVKKVGLDTSRGRVLEITKHLYKAGDPGLTLGTLAMLCSQTEDKKRIMLRFLRKIKAVEVIQTKSKTGLSYHTRYRLAQRVRALYHKCVLQGV
jgi:hypothetical protein